MPQHLFYIYNNSFHNALSGQKPFGEQLKILAISFKCLILYLAFLDDDLISPIKPTPLSNFRDSCYWVRLLAFLLL
jgi:hypothetical protein